MEQAMQFFKEYVLENSEFYLVVIMLILSVFACAVLNLLAKPIKKLNAKINNAMAIKVVNMAFVGIIVGIGIAIWYLVSRYVPIIKFEAKGALITYVTTMLEFMVATGTINVFGAAQVFQKTLKAITDDGKIDKDEAEEIKKALLDAIAGGKIVSDAVEKAEITSDVSDAVESKEQEETATETKVQDTEEAATVVETETAESTETAKAEQSLQDLIAKLSK